MRSYKKNECIPCLPLKWNIRAKQNRRQVINLNLKSKIAVKPFSNNLEKVFLRKTLMTMFFSVLSIHYALYTIGKIGLLVWGKM